MTLPVAGTPEREAFDALINGQQWMKAIIRAASRTRPKNGRNCGTRHTTASDIRAQIDDIFTVYQELGNSSGTIKVMSGHIKAIDQLLTFALTHLWI